jgi:hypothetical protein
MHFAQLFSPRSFCPSNVTFVQTAIQSKSKPLAHSLLVLTSPPQRLNVDSPNKITATINANIRRGSELQARLDALSSRDWQAEIDKAISGIGLEGDEGTKKDGGMKLKLDEGLVRDGDYEGMGGRREGCCCVM